MTKLQDRTTIRLRLWYFLPSDAIRRARYCYCKSSVCPSVCDVKVPWSHTVWVKKNPPLLGDLTFFFIFFTNGWEFVIDFLHTYQTFLSLQDYKSSFNYHQFWRSYAILSATAQFT